MRGTKAQMINQLIARLDELDGEEQAWSIIRDLALSNLDRIELEYERTEDTLQKIEKRKPKGEVKKGSLAVRNGKVVIVNKKEVK